MLGLLEKVKFAREANGVERCHTHPHVLRYSVGQHSADVAALAALTWQEDKGVLPRAELLIAALAHDWPELVFGDVPSPTKSLMGEVLEAREIAVLETLGVAPALTPEEQSWLASCDAVELYLWCCDEANLRGNNTFQGWKSHYEARWLIQPLQTVFMELIKVYRATAHGRLPWVFLAASAGLDGAS